MTFCGRIVSLEIRTLQVTLICFGKAKTEIHPQHDRLRSFELCTVRDMDTYFMMDIFANGFISTCDVEFFSVKTGRN